ncbi:MAG: DNA polymerase I [Clostridia bacterium]
MKEKYLIIDGNSILNRAFYGIMSKMTNSEDVPTNAVYGFMNIYFKILEQVDPKYVTCTFDLKAPTFRHLLYKEYKGQRKPMPEDLKTQMPIIKDVLRAMNIHIIEKEGFEADDVIGSIAKLNEENNIFTYILTGDRDSFQLISSSTNVLMPSSAPGKTEYNVIDEAALMEKYGITPEEVTEVKALMGDASDNIPGVPGIGEKTGYSLIQKYHTIDYIYAHFDDVELKPKQRVNMESGKDMAYLSKTLGTIDVNVDIEYSLVDALIVDINKAETFKIFTYLGFKKFLQKLDFSSLENVETIVPKEEKISVDCKHAYIEKIEEKMQEEISYIIDEEEKKICIYVEKEDTVYIASLEKNLETLAKKDVVKNGYKIKKDIKKMLKEEIKAKEIKGFVFDLELGYFLLHSEKAEPSIKQIAKDILGVEIEVKKEEEQMSLFAEEKKEEELSKEKIEEYKQTLKVICESKKIIMKKLEEQGELELLEKIEMPLVKVLADMEVTGIQIDTEKLEEFNKEISERIKELETVIYNLAGEQFNINSPKQLAEILFNKLGIPASKKNKTGNSTNKEVLEKIEEDHEIVTYILEYRTLAKLKSTYVEGLKPLIDESFRVHTTFMQAVTATGRLSSVEPNLQNIPTRTKIGRNMRKFFVAKEGKCILDADYSQIELRVLAHIANDETMLNAFIQNIDIHSVTASQVFGVELKDVTKEMRSAAKAVNFGIVYGISEFGLAKQIKVSRKEAKMYIENYLEKYNGIRMYMKDIVDKAKKDGYITTLFGRRRYIEELKSTNKNIVQFGERVAMNSPIQGTAADIIKLAMVNIYRVFEEKNIDAKMLLQVHDELLFEIDEKDKDLVMQIVEEEMENVIKLNVPLVAEPFVGKSWYEAK